MKLKHVCLTLAATLVVPFVFVASAVAQGQRPLQQELENRFAAADTNHDGKLTLAEAQAGMPHVAKYFDQIDATHKGYVTVADIEQFFAQHRQ
ncbi:EF-hand domain-containing protein [Trinickia fusca]|uniref:EF-hand domain-containing protein n=2 Tax=Trinickia fusca TaxID=2419777 RepID=A0A494XBQ1_9BURK|nr:EF-hand domain-containing protein [Trinickia fusca]